MKKYVLENDQPVFGMQVKSFPLGISETFSALSKTIENGPGRPYYGISYIDTHGQVIYKAAALERYEGEAKKYNCERYLIEKGDYLTETIYDWRNKLDSIKDVFGEIMKDSRIDTAKPCVEWYKSEAEMMCMIKTAQPL